MFVEKGSAVLTPKQVEELLHLASAGGRDEQADAAAFADLAAAVKQVLK